MDDLILITGAARSGVSLIASVLHICGAWTGRTIQSAKGYGRGSWENIDIRELMVRPFLRGIKADPIGQTPLPDIEICKKLGKKIAPQWARLTKAILRKQGYERGPLFLVSPISCLIWPVWAEAFPRARWILVRRSDSDIVKSCMNTGYMTGYTDAKGWQLWLETHKARFREMITAGLNVWQIWPERMTRGKLAELHELVKHLGLKWDVKCVKDSITPILWKKGVF